MATLKNLQYASVSASSSGNNEIVAAVAGKSIKVVNYVLVATSAVSAKWRSANTDKSGAMPFAASGGASAAGSIDAPLLATTAGEALNLNLSGAVLVAGHVAYYTE